MFNKNKMYANDTKRLTVSASLQGKFSANVTRHFISKMAMSIVAFYGIYYYMKYNRMVTITRIFQHTKCNIT